MSGKTNKVDLNKIKWGCDPEFFASYTGPDGVRYVLPPVVFRNDLDAPFEDNGSHPIYANYEGTKVHEDGAAFEMSTPPSTDWRTMWYAIHEAKARFSEDFLKNYPSVCDGILHSIPSMQYQVSRWINRGPEFDMAVTFGCDPDEDAFNTSAKARVIDATQHPWRYAGGHIHISGIDGLYERPLPAIISMMLTAGLASIAYSTEPVLEKERLFLYGKPGKFRIQKYPDGTTGVEYRTPSTMWTGSIELAERVFTWADIGIKNLFAGGLLNQASKLFLEPAKQAITNVDQKLAVDILNSLEELV